MKKTLKQSITGYNMPLYLTEILTKHYCERFLRMSIMRDGESYMFTYDIERFRRLEIRKLNTAEKLVLIETLIKINRENEEHLIMADCYLIEPELIYSINNMVNLDRVRLLFYPDFKRMSFQSKIKIFIDKLTDRRKANEVEVFEHIKEMVGSESTVKTLRYIGKIKERSIVASA